MKKLISLLTGGLLLIFSQSLIAQADYQVARTEYGQPDLQGVWNFASHTPVQRNESLGNRAYFTPEENEENRERSVTAFEARAESHFDGVGGYNSFWYERATIGYDLRTSLITYPENGRLPPIVEGAFMQRGGVSQDFPSERPVRFVVGGIAKDGPEDRGLSERCIAGFNAGPPFMPSSYNNNVQIIQHRDHIVIMTEMIHDARMVPLDTEHELSDDIRLWSGDSRGYWEGDTLVVETKNFNGLTQSFISSPYGHSYDKSLVERFTRVSPDTVEYEFTIDDPSTFTDKITAMIPMTKVDGLMYEYSCHEGNYGMENMIRGARREEADALGSN
ncbi:MAG: hypothetical protein OXU30_12010 [Gammaproteobacteria bacterium]|nr:hypothetical protein [Gammaproteobacteria bacterium]MDD9896626.1 hypothetical protein [Gammaproteobacteria bacterium]